MLCGTPQNRKITQYYSQQRRMPIASRAGKGEGCLLRRRGEGGEPGIFSLAPGASSLKKGAKLRFHLRQGSVGRTGGQESARRQSCRPPPLLLCIITSCQAEAVSPVRQKQTFPKNKTGLNVRRERCQATPYERNQTNSKKIVFMKNNNLCF